MAGFTTPYCVDDILAVDRKTIFSRWLTWRVLATGLYLMQSVLFHHELIAFLVQHPQPGVFWKTSLLRRLLQLALPVGTGLCIINVPYVALEDLVDSSHSTLTVT